MKALLIPIAAACMALTPVVASAQQDLAEVICKRAPADKKAACVTFVKTYRWDDGASQYVRRDNGKPLSEAVPGGVPTRAEINAQKAKFLAANKWDEGKSAWIPIGQTRPVCVDAECKETRKEVEADAKQFMKTHRWDEGSSQYVLIKK